MYVLADDYAGLNSPFIAQHGASYWIEVFYPDDKRYNILFDTGTYHEPILFNMEKLGLNLSDIDYIVISHSHYDHTGGLLGILDAINKENIPIIAPSTLLEETIHAGERLRIIGVPIPTRLFARRIEEKGGRLLLIDDPIDILQGVKTTGVFRDIVSDGSRIRNLYRIVDGRLEEESLADEIALVIKTENTSLLITGCAHPGITNIIRKASTLIGAPIENVIGGFHLVGKKEDEIKEIIGEMKSLGVRHVYPGHCTGLTAQYLMKKEYGNNCTILRAGLKISIE